MVPLIVTLEVNGHFLSMYCPSIAAVGVLNPEKHSIKFFIYILTKTNFL